jgi:predicted esterase
MKGLPDVWILVGVFVIILSFVGVWLYYFLKVRSYERLNQNDNSSESSGSSYRPLNSEIIQPSLGEKHLYTLFWLHGLGDVPSSWKAGTLSFNLKNTKIVLPAAPISPVTINGGMKMPSWFDIMGLTIGSPEDQEGIHLASQNLACLINEEMKHVDPLHIAIGGFSQGGAVALNTAFVDGYLQHQIGCVVGLSCWLPGGSSIVNQSASSSVQLSSINSSTPLFMVRYVLCILVLLIFFCFTKCY